MDHKKHILSYTRRAVDDYQMIQKGDKIAIGVSAGKDSLALLCSMATLKRFYPIPFELLAITVDMGFEGGSDFSSIAKLCETLEVPYKVVPSEIAKIVFDVRKEPSPCSLCAKLRRGALHNAAKAEGCTSVALGHHFDDAVETFMLNLFYEGRIGCFQPVTYLSRVGLRVIRPLLYAPEKEVSHFVRASSIVPVPKNCPADGNTRREDAKRALAELEHRDRGVKMRIFNAFVNTLNEKDGLK